MEENVKTVLSNQVFENKKRKQNKKELFWINLIVGIIIIVLMIIAFTIILSQKSGIKAYPFVLVAGVLFIMDVITAVSYTHLDVYKRQSISLKMYNFLP